MNWLAVTVIITLPNAKPRNGLNCNNNNVSKLANNNGQNNIFIDGKEFVLLSCKATNNAEALLTLTF